MAEQLLTQKRLQAGAVLKQYPLHPGLPPSVEVGEKHWRPKNRERVLRHIGEDLEKACELAGRHLKNVKAFKEERDKRGSYDWSPYPKGATGKKRG